MFPFFLFPISIINWNGRFSLFHGIAFYVAALIPKIKLSVDIEERESSVTQSICRTGVTPEIIAPYKYHHVK